jgi:hypothetical protein
MTDRHSEKASERLSFLALAIDDVAFLIGVVANSRSSTLRNDRGKRTYINTTSRITSGEELKYGKGLSQTWSSSPASERWLAGREFALT